MATRRPRLGVVLVSLAAAIGMQAGARGVNYREQMVNEAVDISTRGAQSLDAIMSAPAKAIPADILSRAKAIVVFPRVVKRSIELEGNGGPGVASRYGARGWGSPVFLRGVATAATPPIGAPSADYVLLLLDEPSVNGLMKKRFEPVPGSIASYSRDSGSFAAVDLRGVVITPQDELNMAVYTDTALEMLSEHLDERVDTPRGVNAFALALNRLLPRSGNARRELR